MKMVVTVILLDASKVFDCVGKEIYFFVLLIPIKEYVSDGEKQEGCLSPTASFIRMNYSLKFKYKTLSVVDMAFKVWATLLCLCFKFTVIFLLSRIKEMLKTCEDYAMEYIILFNAKSEHF